MSELPRVFPYNIANLLRLDVKVLVVKKQGIQQAQYGVLAWQI